MFLEFNNGEKRVIIDANHITVVREEDNGCHTVILYNGNEYTVTNNYEDIRTSLFLTENEPCS